MFDINRPLHKSSSDTIYTYYLIKNSEKINKKKKTNINSVM